MKSKPNSELLNRYHAKYKTDSIFAANARLLQSVWREGKGYEFEKFGNLLPVDFAKSTKANYLTIDIGNLVEVELKNTEKMIGQPRIWNNLLSSQPLAFNLFGELKLETSLKTATAVFAELFPDKVHQVTGIEFEYSPSRRNPKYTNDGSAFDVFITYDSTEDKKCFLGIEVKYSEAMNDAPARLRSEYEAIATAMGVFKPESMEELKNTFIQQLWRDHLLAASMFITNRDYTRGDFIALYPEANTQCQNAIDKYQHTFKAGENYFVPLIMERFYEVLSKHTDADWAKGFYDRYLNFAKLAKL